jgi:hypothetical protein
MRNTMHLSFVALIILGLTVLGACSTDNGDVNALCEQSCAKLEECMPGTICTIDPRGCTEEDRAVNQCVVDSTCDEIGACLAAGA